MSPMSHHRPPAGSLTTSEVHGLTTLVLNHAGLDLAGDQSALHDRRTIGRAATVRHNVDDARLLLAAVAGTAPVHDDHGHPLTTDQVNGHTTAAAVGIARVISALLAADSIAAHPLCTPEEAATARAERTAGFAALSVDVTTAVACATRISQLGTRVTART